ncbi:MAG TPA: lipopolysaccharide assembly protein LapA domain-containing protein [Burkholderiales bacterium]|nr:lipopolysaccharide assembly protein LapA domain-containing protein [Burkholderiales bacterium]
MRIVAWAIRLIVFVLLVAFAAKNVEPVTLRFYFDLALQAPLVVLLFAFFAAGALFGIAALLGTLLRQRREISALRSRSSSAEPAKPPLPEL